MNAESECWECGKLVPGDELAEGDDGRLLCCCCHLEQLEGELAEKVPAGRPPDQDRRATEPVSEIHLGALRGLPPSDPDPSSWTSTY